MMVRCLPESRFALGKCVECVRDILPPLLIVGRWRQDLCDVLISADLKFELHVRGPR
jgi:hypothetical protein